MKTASSLAAVAGVTVAALGLVPLTQIVFDETPTPDQVVEQEATTTTEVVPETTIIEIEPPNLEGVDAALSRVLYAYGAASGVQPGATPELPEQIVKVLAYYQVTLSVAEEGSP